ncbi:MAG TPA: tetratricopeptide repeat protein, partial [Candidatus Polarisedimenticolia bacterium]|nr:tetratricopeptide repeat protein [Candidatus Polarisedimenticolia bacterium]
MVFFEGAPGWHDKPTTFEWEVQKSPATMDMTVGTTPIQVSYRAETRALRIMGQDFDLATDNVFLVFDIDGPFPRVKGLGTHDLIFASADNPALSLLGRNSYVRTALLGESAGVSDSGRTAAEAPPDLVAMDRQGLVLLGRNTPEDDRQACDLFARAAAGGHAPSQYRVGLCHGSGRGFKEDLAVANQWYLKAAEQGYTDAQYKLAHSYRVGRGTAVDLGAARHWYLQAAEAGDAQAQYNLGMMYATGLGSEIDS